MKDLQQQFLLQHGLTYLNHGSFGAIPKFLIDQVHLIEHECELNPHAFLVHMLDLKLRDARLALGQYLNIPDDCLALVPNATHGVNIVLNSLDLKKGDQILTTNLDYGACIRAVSHYAHKNQASVKIAEIPLPLTDDDLLIDFIWQNVNSQTKVLMFSHITSATSSVFPVKKICEKARQEGILTLVDGAHAPAQLDLDIGDLDCDFYTGNCHKWMCSPRSAAFLYVRPEFQPKIKPLVVSWGKNRNNWTGPEFIADHEWIGTMNFSAYIVLPDVIKFLKMINWENLRSERAQLLNSYEPVLQNLLGTGSLYSNHQRKAPLMRSFVLPAEVSPNEVVSGLYDDYSIQAWGYDFDDMPILRLSLHAYNDKSDLERFISALGEILHTQQSSGDAN